MCDGVAAGMGIGLIRLKLAQPWLDNGSLVRLGASPVFTSSVPSPHAHYLCWRTGMMERWECMAFADWLRQSVQ
ncbi:MAG: LysR family transcriptional regulator [Comamonadaceae bacterium]|nr:MAG: LysR family transcriptional regulator [Comamonadaceae bacterium]